MTISFFKYIYIYITYVTKKSNKYIQDKKRKRKKKFYDSKLYTIIHVKQI